MRLIQLRRKIINQNHRTGAPALLQQCVLGQQQRASQHFLLSPGQAFRGLPSLDIEAQLGALRPGAGKTALPVELQLLGKRFP